MTPSDPKARQDFLVHEIRRHDQAYYVRAEPEVSDFQYDQLYSELQELERQHPEWITPE
ncbi:MAG: DNA ligase LigA-related protein, partial [Verrucomicrobiota bacterium]